MFYIFDNSGWYTGQSGSATPRSTELDPVNYSLTEVDGEMRANWTGYSWVDREYKAPPPQQQNPHADGRITVDAFYQRFTPTEWADVNIASQWDAAASNSVKRTAARLRNAFYEHSVMPHLDLNKNRLRSWVLDLETAGHLAAGRALIILDTAIESGEVPPNIQ